MADTRSSSLLSLDPARPSSSGATGNGSQSPRSMPRHSRKTNRVNRCALARRTPSPRPVRWLVGNHAIGRATALRTLPFGAENSALTASPPGWSTRKTVPQFATRLNRARHGFDFARKKGRDPMEHALCSQIEILCLLEESLRPAPPTQRHAHCPKPKEHHRPCSGLGNAGNLRHANDESFVNAVTVPR